MKQVENEEYNKNEHKLILVWLVQNLDHTTYHCNLREVVEKI